MSGCSKCNGKGFIGEEACTCRILEIFERYLSPFRGIGGVHTNVQNFVNRLLLRHKTLESTITNKTGIDTKIPIKWYLIDPEPPTKSVQEDVVRNGTRKKVDTVRIDYDMWFERGIKQTGLGVPKNFYKHLFFYYLYVTKDYLDYSMFSLAELTNIYYSDDSEDTFTNTKGKNVWFYGIRAKTLVLVLDTVLTTKESMNILVHFLRTYSDRNVLIYATHEYRRLPEITKWTEGGYNTFKAGDRSLYDILRVDFKKEFVDLMDDNTFKGIISELTKEGSWQKRN